MRYAIHAQGKTYDALDLEHAIASGRQAAAAGACGVAVTRGDRPVWGIWRDEAGHFRETRTPKYVEEVRRFALSGRGDLPC